MSTKEYGCLLCSGKSAKFDGTCPSCGAPINLSADLLTLTIEGMRVTEVLGRGFYGWTLKVEDELPQAFAVKIIPSHRIKAGRNPLQEPRSLVQCSPHRNIARFVRSFTTTLSLRETEVEAACMVFDYVPDAQPLRGFIESPPADLGRADVVAVLSGIAWGLTRMHARDLWHNDLHDDNILVRPVARDEGAAHRFEAVLIDFGSTRPLILDRPNEHERGDYYYLGKHIYGLLDAFQRVRFPKLTQVDRSLVTSLRRLAHRLMDRDASRRADRPEEIAAAIDGAQAESSTGHARPPFEVMHAETKLSFRYPLGNSNALNLKPQDIVLLFRDRLRWISQIERSETVVIVGPRGCGKTMLLRHLSIQNQAWPRRDESRPEDVATRLTQAPFLGFLVSCYDIRSPFLRSGYKYLQDSAPETAEDFCREYFNGQFALEVIRSLVWLRIERMAEISGANLHALARTLNDLLGESVGGRRANACADIDVVMERLEKRVVDLSNLLRPEDYLPSNLCRSDVLLLLARAIRTIPLAESRDIYFMLDDYSVTVVQEFVQRAYNPVLFNPSSEIRVKITSEGDGPELGDTLSRQYREGRELTRVNLGEVYFSASEQAGREFLEEVLQARCKETGHGSVARLKELMGEHPDEGQFGAYICKIAAHGHSGKGSGRAGDARFFGFGLLCRLCSGDVSYVIELLRALVGDDWASIREPLTAAAQDLIVKRFARQQLRDLKRTPPHGEQLHEFAVRIGVLVRKYLLASTEKKTKDERLRIEIEGAGCLSGDALAIHRGLLRHSVLVDGGYGKSRRGEPTRKLYIRRLFAPCFPFSPNRKGCIAISVATYEKWLRHPTSIGPGLSEDEEGFSLDGRQQH